MGKIKLLLISTSAMLVLFYIYSMNAFGVYSESVRYAVSIGIVLLFSAATVLKEKLFSGKRIAVKQKENGRLGNASENKKTAAVFTAVILAGCVALTGYSQDMGYKYNIILFSVSICPIVFYFLARHINVGKKVKASPLCIDFLIYNGAVFLCIYIVAEVICAYKAYGTDTVAELYMYAVALICFFISRKGSSGIKLKEIAFMLITAGVVVYIWMTCQSRVSEIIAGMGMPADATDVSGEPLNWLAYRMQMVKAVITGDFSAINPRWRATALEGCPVTWLSWAGEWYVLPAFLLLIAALSVSFFLYSGRAGNGYGKAIAYALIIRTGLGVVLNLFMIFSTVVDFPLISNAYDAILIIFLMLCQ